MARITPINLIAQMSGKLSKRDNTYFATYHQTGHVYAFMRTVREASEPSPAQMEVRTKFAQRAINSHHWIADNAPSDANPKGTELYQKVMLAFKKQHKVATFFGYVSTRMGDDGKLNFN